MSSVNHVLDVGLGDEGDPFTVGRPSGLIVIEITGGDLSHLLGGDIENEEVIAAVIEVADGVLFKLETVDNERWRSFRFGRCGLVLVFRGFGVFGFWILKDENEASTVGGPFEIVDTLGDVGELLRFAAAAK